MTSSSGHVTPSSGHVTPSSSSFAVNVDLKSLMYPNLLTGSEYSLEKFC